MPSFVVVLIGSLISRLSSKVLNQVGVECTFISQSQSWLFYNKSVTSIIHIIFAAFNSNPTLAARSLSIAKISQQDNIAASYPQSSSLGPCLFGVHKVHTSDLTDSSDLIRSALDINHDLQIIKRWTHKWRMS